MKNYFNKYNVVNWTILVLVATLSIERLSWFLINQMNLSTWAVAVIFIWSLRLVLIVTVGILFYTILIEFGNRNAEFDYFRNSIKSYIATWKIRRYCTQINVEPSLEESSRYLNTKQVIIKKVNRSLQALTVTYYENHAILKGRLPANSESSDILEELFPKIKRELNYMDKSYHFSDIIRDHESKNFSSVATRDNGNILSPPYRDS
ncbi:hypothetical protein STRDD10_01139 [Streptococcus sp. DD10]|uniref:hypothetical protein n=1 Tax=Streptococcus sp. DD10 TaxID=1777878 RepID=UPI00079A73AE|nr:hypothetical protein [Streptococcus sp. DD10]KXT74179.1 hypothetical protein STRDD10_01139 [Streptococcus sp. DD10]